MEAGFNRSRKSGRAGRADGSGDVLGKVLAALAIGAAIALCDLAMWAICVGVLCLA